jgi:hypothetical protein
MIVALKFANLSQALGTAALRFSSRLPCAKRGGKAMQAVKPFPTSIPPLQNQGVEKLIRLERTRGATDSVSHQEFVMGINQ